MNQKAELVDKHEARFSETDARLENMHAEVCRHADREERALDHLKTAIAAVQSDVGYMRGYIEGQARPQSGAP